MALRSECNLECAMVRMFSLAGRVLRSMSFVRWLMFMRCAGVVVVLASVERAGATTVRELTRVRGEGEFKMSGLGLVTGLRGTGDDAKEAIVARPLSQLFTASGNEPGSLKEFAKGKSVAVVWVTCTIPEKGAMADDRIDVHVSTLLSAASLAGGRLLATPLRGVLPGQPVNALAEGELVLEEATNLTNARVRRGAVMLEDVRGPALDDVFDLIIEAPFMGWASANQIAGAINGKADPINNAVAVAVDERTVKITVPRAERGDRSGFLSDVFSADVNPALMDLPAQVVVNRRTGAIVVTGNVVIRPTAIAHRDLTITTTSPMAAPTLANPLVSKGKWAEMKTDGPGGEATKLTDLIGAFKQLNLPVAEQIELLQMLHKSGELQGKLVID